MLTPERRYALVLYSIRAGRENKAQFVQRLVSRGGGFRPATLNSWPAEKLAREVVRLKAESSNDEHDLLQIMYVDLEPAIQTTFLDAAGVAHENGRMADSLEQPYAGAEAVRRGAAAVREKHGADGDHYLRTIARYSLQGWPGIDAIVAEMDAS